MPRARNPENKGLPARWRVLHGAYYYEVPTCMREHWDNKKLFRLGKSLSEAHHSYADRVGVPTNAKTVNELLERYELEVVPTKKISTQTGNINQLKMLRLGFGHWGINAVTPQSIYQYVDKRSAKISARREIALLSHAFTKAVEWGYIPNHPFKGEIRLKGEKPRTRYVEDWELEECLNLKPRRDGNDATKFIQAYLRLKMLIGLRQGDMLCLRIADFTEEGIPVTTSKTGKRVIFSWSPALRAAVKEAMAVRPVDISPWLFCTRRGECYVKEKNGVASGFQSIWQRFMRDRVLKETKVTESFTEHDIRAKAGSDAESDQRGQSLLGHDNVGMTKRVYRRRPEIVVPLH